MFEAGAERAGAVEAGTPSAEQMTAAITEDEVRIVGELLKGRFNPTELWGREPEEGS
jgi:hypothetical protein